MNDRDIREILAQELASAAAWRREAARAHPQHRAHSNSAAAIDQLIAYIRALPKDDPRLRALAELNRDPDFFLLGGDETRDLLDRYGTDAPPAGDPKHVGDVFLSGLISAVQTDEDTKPANE
ncbi:MAG: hypothetical protein ACTHNU_01810 [Gaiellales bacterium]